MLRMASGENIECRAVVECDGVGSRIARESLGLETPDWEGAIQDVIQATPRDEMVASSISDRWVAPWELKSREGGAITLAGDGLHPMTPNLGQGGCCALEDAVVLSRMVEDHPGDLALAFRKYEEKRALRCLPLTIRAHVMGFLLQIDNPIVCAVRNAVVERIFSPKSFLDHTLYDCRVE